MASYGWFPVTFGFPFVWHATGTWSNAAYWANLGSASFPPVTGTVPGVTDDAYLLSGAISPSPAFPYPASPYPVDVTVNSPVTIANLGMAVFEQGGATVAPPQIDITGTSFIVTGAIVDHYTQTFPTPIGTQTVTGGGIITLANTATLEVGTTIDPQIVVVFNDGLSNIVRLDGVSNATPTAASGLFEQFQAGDLIDLPNVPYAMGNLPVSITSYNPSTGELVLGALGGVVTYAELTIVGSGLTASNFFLQPDATGGTEIAVCFAEGTLIRTPDGERAVETLVPGSLVMTHDPKTGAETAMTVRWLGHRHIDLARRRQPELVRPIRIAASAFADGVPARQLTVSPEHAMFIDGALIPARLLVNGVSIVQDQSCRAVRYFHLELDHHAILLAEGAPAESWLDTGNRDAFDNGDAVALHPDFSPRHWPDDACAPLGVAPEIVEPVWRRIAARAGLQSHGAMSASAAEPWLEADGARIAAITELPGRHLFVIPSGARTVRLRAAASRPADAAPWLDDRRALGVAVARIRLHAGDEVREMALDHPALAVGWWDAERDGIRSWRWTDGDAALPVPTGTRMVEIHTTAAVPAQARAEAA